MTAHHDENSRPFELMDEADPKLTKFPTKIFLFWAIGSMFYMYQSILKVSTGLFAKDLQIDLNISATSLGALGAIYFLAYSLMQVPIGIMLDRFGVRRLLTIAITLCASGALVFSMSNNLFMALCGRFLIGMGASGAFIGTIKIVTMWFPNKLIPVFTGLSVFAGSLGSVAGNKPLAILLETQSWRQVMQLLAIAGILLAILYFAIVRNKETSSTSTRTLKEIFVNIKDLFKSPQILLIASFAFLIYVPLTVFADMWGNIFLQQAYNLTKSDAAGCIQLIYFGVGFGAPMFGIIASMYTNYRILFRLVSAAQLPILAGIIWFKLPSIEMLKTFLFMLGIMLGGQALKFNAAFAHSSPKISASVVGFVNMMCMFSGFIFQQIVGLLLDISWDGLMKDGAPLYSQRNFSFALSMHLVTLALCFFLTYYIKNKDQEEDDSF